MRHRLARCAVLITLFFSTTGELCALTRTEVQTLIDEGERLFVMEEYERALNRYRRALDASDAHGLLFMIARCQQSLGRDREAIDTFRVFLSGTDLAMDAREKAEQAVVELERRLSRGRLTVEVVPTGAAIAIDGAPAGRAPLPAIILAPGPHEVHVSAPDHAPKTRFVEVPAGGAARLSVVLAAHRGPAPVVVSGGVTPESPGASPWQWVTLGTGAALVVGGAVLWWLGEEDFSAIEDGRREQTMSETRAQELRDSGRTKRTSGHVLVGVGAASLATSTVLFVLDATIWDADAEVHTARPAIWHEPGGVVLGVEGGF